MLYCDIYGDMKWGSVFAWHQEVFLILCPALLYQWLHAETQQIKVIFEESLCCSRSPLLQSDWRCVCVPFTSHLMSLKVLMYNSAPLCVACRVLEQEFRPVRIISSIRSSSSYLKSRQGPEERNNIQILEAGRRHSGAEAAQKGHLLLLVVFQWKHLI